MPDGKRCRCAPAVAMRKVSGDTSANSGSAFTLSMSPARTLTPLDIAAALWRQPEWAPLIQINRAAVLGRARRVV